MRPASTFINASRGEVLDEECLLLGLQQEWIEYALLDVFQNEPAIDPRVVDAAFLATPHIAGYSYEGRVRGTAMCYQEACRFLEIEPRWQPPAFERDEKRTIVVDPRGKTVLEALQEIVSCAYDIEADDRALRSGMHASEAERRAHFQRLRSAYPDRREFPSYTVHLLHPSSDLEERIHALGFHLASSS